MRKLLKTIKDREVFDRAYPTIKAYNSISNAGQVISLFSEAVIFALITYQNLGKWMPELYFFGYLFQTGVLFSFIIGLSAATLLEIAVKTSTIDVVKTILGVNKTGSAILRITFMLLFYFICGASSWFGMKYTASKIIPAPPKETTAGIDTMYKQKIAMAGKLYREDSLAIVNQYAPQAATLRQLTKSKIAQQNNYIATFQQKEKAEGQSYATRIAAHRANIEKYKTELSTALAALSEQQAKALQPLLTQKQNTTTFAESVHQKEVTRIRTENEATTLAHQATVERCGNIMAWLTIILLIFLPFTTYQHQQLLKDAGVEYEIHLANRELEAGYLSELWHIAGEVISEKLRAPLYAKANKLMAKHREAQLEKAAYFSMWRDFDNAKQKAINIADPDAQPDDLLPSSPGIQVAAKTASNGAAITASIPVATTATTTANNQNQPATYGSRIATAAPVTANSKSYICANGDCGKPFQKTVWNKRFCSENCKHEAWVRENGREPFMKKKR